MRLVLMLSAITCLLAAVGSEAPAVWHVETVDRDGNVGWYSSLACDNQDNLHVSYYDETRQALKYAYFNGSAWSVQTVDADRCGRYTSLALDSRNQPHISYAGNGLRHAFQNGKTWNLTQVNREYLQFSTSLALGPGETRNIAHNVGQRLAFARWNGQRWQSEAIPARGGPMDCSLALNAHGRPVVAYVANSYDDLQLVAWNGKAWVPNHPASTPDNDGYWPSLAVDRKGGLHVSAWNASAGDLKYCLFNGSRWSAEAPDTAGNTGWYSSLALDADGNPHISYHNHTDWDLKYAVKRGGTWRSETVDAVGAVGYATSLALDSRGRPRISYYDVGQQDLKVAQWREGTNSVQGTVSAQNGQPVSGAYVFLRSRTLLANARTDRLGRFSFAQVPAGEYVVAPVFGRRPFRPGQAVILLDHEDRKDLAFAQE